MNKNVSVVKSKLCYCYIIHISVVTYLEWGSPFALKEGKIYLVKYEVSEAFFKKKSILNKS